jgi:fatty acid desaturase
MSGPPWPLSHFALGSERAEKREKSMETRMAQDSSLPIQAKAVVSDLSAPKQWIYWVDFLSCILVAWATLVLTMSGTIGPLQTAFAMTVCVIALYRSVIFIHELAHLGPESFKAFRFVWNLLCGVPFLVPSFTYTAVHNDHHKRKIYGTQADGEYVGFATQSPGHIVGYFLLFPLLPLMQVIRFAVLTPLSFLHPRLRELLWTHASSLTIDLAYRRPAPGPRDGRFWRVQEFGSMAFSLSVLALVATGVIPWQALLVWYAAASSVFLLNSLRTLAAHRYRNPGEVVMDTTEQYLDSVNVPGNFLTTAIWAPVGLRYHATHHLMQRLPYHALGKAHRRLIAELPDNSVYIQANRRSLADALRRLWIDADTTAGLRQAELPG